MSARQLQACVERLNERNPIAAQTFSGLMARSAHLLLEGWALRTAAWEVYRKHIPATPRKRGAR